MAASGTISTKAVSSGKVYDTLCSSLEAFDSSWRIGSRLAGTSYDAYATHVNKVICPAQVYSTHGEGIQRDERKTRLECEHIVDPIPEERRVDQEGLVRSSIVDMHHQVSLKHLEHSGFSVDRRKESDETYVS